MPTTTTTSPRRTRQVATSVTLLALYVLAMAAAFALGTGPAARVMWAVAAAALAGALLFAQRSDNADREGAR